MFTLIVAVLAVAIVVFFYQDYRRRAGANTRHPVPPGPLGWPIVGYYPFLGDSPQDTFTKLGEKYGKIFRLPVGSINVVVLNDLDVIKEALVKQGHHFEARANAFHDTYYMMDNVGVFVGSVESVRDLRRMVTSTLKDFGVGKVTCEDFIYKECEMAIAQIDAHKTFDPTLLFSFLLSNIMTRFLFGKRYDHDNPKFLKLIAMAQKVDEVIGRMSTIDFMPWMRYLPEKLRGSSSVPEIRKEFHEFMGEIIDEHIRTFNEKRIGNFVEVYLDRMRKQKITKTNDPEKYSFMIRQLRSFLLETFSGGTGSGAISLSLIMKVFTTKPEMQQKVLDEIDRVIGQDRSPSYADHLNMPYTEATTFESMRYANITPLGTYKSNAEPVTISGYNIPPKSLVFANIGRQHFLPEAFANPNVFDPAHCLDENGKCFRPEHSLPFGIGRRLCPGQTFAETQLFLIVTSLLQKFTFHPTANSENDAENESSGERTTVIYMKPFQVRAERRN